MTTLADARYTMKADVFDEATQQERSGRVKRTFDYNNPVTTITCLATVMTPLSSRLTFTEIWGQQYSDSIYVRIVTAEPLTNRQRVGNIVTRSGNYLSPTNKVFDILLVAPILDVFGNLIEYEALAAEVQNQ